MAAVASILRRSAYSLAPLSLRLISTRTIHCPAKLSALNHASTTFLRGPFAPRYYSEDTQKSTSKQTLLDVLNSEIKLVEESAPKEKFEEEIPDGFPFQIEDNPGQQTIFLSREYQGETIKVEIFMPNLITGQYADDSDSDDGRGRNMQSNFPLVVSVSKKNGPSLRFTCTAFPDEIFIQHLSVKNPEISEDRVAYEGPQFSDLEESLQKTFHKYLEIRGIKPSTTNFLHEYMINKDEREYLVWLQNLKKFTET